MHWTEDTVWRFKDLADASRLQRLETPDWAKRDWVPGVAPSSAPPCQQGSEEVPANRPLNRGPVARRLNIDSVSTAPRTCGEAKSGGGSYLEPAWGRAAQISPQIPL